MCGLIYSSGPDRSARLVNANLARAGRNKGAFTFTPVKTTLGMNSVGESVRLDPRDAGLHGPGIFHLQAPTCAESKPHPAVSGNISVWHNGIIKPAGMELLRQHTGSDENWDTHLLAKFIEINPPFTATFRAVMERLEGSFACIITKDKALLAFRNAIAPLYTGNGDMSSVAVNGCDTMIGAGYVYTLGMGGWMSTGHAFEPGHNPYDL